MIRLVFRYCLLFIFSLSITTFAGMNFRDLAELSFIEKEHRKSILYLAEREVTFYKTEIADFLLSSYETINPKCHADILKTEKHKAYAAIGIPINNLQIMKANNSRQILVKATYSVGFQNKDTDEIFCDY